MALRHREKHAQAKMSAMQAVRDSALLMPQDWVELVNAHPTGDHDRVYFANLVTKETQWHHPALPDPSRAYGGGDEEGDDDRHGRHDRASLSHESSDTSWRRGSYFGAHTGSTPRPGHATHRGIECDAAAEETSRLETERALLEAGIENRLRMARRLSGYGRELIGGGSDSTRPATGGVLSAAAAAAAAAATEEGVVGGHVVAVGDAREGDRGGRSLQPQPQPQHQQRTGRVQSVAVTPGDFRVADTGGAFSRLVELPFGVHSDPSDTDHDIGIDSVDLRPTFERYCMTARQAARGQRPAPGSLQMSGSNFLRFVRGARLLEASRLEHHDVDATFAKCLAPGARKMTYEAFHDFAIPLLAERMFPGAKSGDAIKLCLRELVIHLPHDTLKLSPQLREAVQSFAPPRDPTRAASPGTAQERAAAAASRRRAPSEGSRGGLPTTGRKGTGHVPPKRTLHGNVDLADTLRRDTTPPDRSARDSQPRSEVDTAVAAAASALAAATARAEAAGMDGSMYPTSEASATVDRRRRRSGSRSAYGDGGASGMGSASDPLPTAGVKGVGHVPPQRTIFGSVDLASTLRTG